MKLRVRLPFRQRNQGYAALAMVAVIGISALLGLMMVFRGAMRSHEVQIRNQIKIDYRQKEDALLRAIVSIVPNKAIGAMTDNSAGSPAQYSWDQIFTEAIDASNTENALNAAVVSGFGIAGVINANTGDMSLTDNTQIVGVLDGSNGTLVGPGSTANAGLLSNADVGSKLPQALNFTGAASLDNTYPIISTEKTYPATAAGLGASATDYPLYNLIPYPNIRFGLAEQGQNFIAKRNWWAFSLTFGNGITLANNTGTADTAIPTVTKNYVLSIYEVPSQMALSAGAKLQLGTYADGSAWQNTTLEGRAFASDIETNGTLGLDGMATRRNITVNGVESAFNSLGVRENRQRVRGDDFFGFSTAGDSGRVAILPLSQGTDFIRRPATPSNTLSPTGWAEYALGAHQCAMRIEVTRFAAINGDTVHVANSPDQVTFYYLDTAGVEQSIDFVQPAPGETYTANGAWENWNRDEYFDQDTSAESIIPFYFENVSETGNPALTIRATRLPDFLASIPGAAGVDVNNSLYIHQNVALGATTITAGAPSDPNEMAVVFRGGDDATSPGADMTAFTTGFSLVTDHRVYLTGHINQEAGVAPANSGWPAGVTYLPPLSIFAADKRYGTSADSISGGTLNISGQLTSLADDDGSTVNPLDIQTGVATDSTRAVAGTVNTTLTQLLSPAQLPPVNKMSWLVVIEEIQPDP